LAVRAFAKALVTEKTGWATGVNGATKTEWQRQERDFSISLSQSIFEEDAEKAARPCCGELFVAFRAFRCLPVAVAQFITVARPVFCPPDLTHEVFVTGMTGRLP
jgi:hypothetical protein